MTSTTHAEGAPLSPAEQTALSALSNFGGPTEREDSALPVKPEDAEPALLEHTPPAGIELPSLPPAPASADHPPTVLVSAPTQASNHPPAATAPLPNLPYGFPFTQLAGGPPHVLYPGPPGKPPVYGIAAGVPFPGLPGYPPPLHLAQMLQQAPIAAGTPNGEGSEVINSPIVRLASYGKDNSQTVPMHQKPGRNPQAEESEDDDGIPPTAEEQQQINAAIAVAEASGVSRRDMKYMCQTCNRVFTRLYNLKSHIRSHQGLRPYKCKQCPASFTRNHDLNR